MFSEQNFPSPHVESGAWFRGPQKQIKAADAQQREVPDTMSDTAGAREESSSIITDDKVVDTALH